MKRPDWGWAPDIRVVTPSAMIMALLGGVQIYSLLRDHWHWAAGIFGRHIPSDTSGYFRYAIQNGRNVSFRMHNGYYWHWCIPSPSYAASLSTSVKVVQRGKSHPDCQRVGNRGLRDWQRCERLPFHFPGSITNHIHCFISDEALINLNNCRASGRK